MTKPHGQSESAAEGPTQQGDAERASDAPTVGAVPAAKRGAIYTMTAREGLDASELVKAAFGRKTIGAVTPRRVEVVAPDGPSTAGGKRARQTIRLVPVTGDGTPVMCGYLDVARRVVELRSYRGLTQQYEERFGKTFDVTQSEYEALVRELEATLGPFRYTFSREADAPAVRATLSSSNASAPNARLLNLVLLTLATLIASGVVLAIVLR